MRRHQSGSGAEDDELHHHRQHRNHHHHLRRPSATAGAGNNTARRPPSPARSHDSRRNKSPMGARRDGAASKEEVKPNLLRDSATIAATKDVIESDPSPDPDHITSTANPSASPSAQGPAHSKLAAEMIPDPGYKHRPRLRSPWSCTPLTLFTTLFAAFILATISRSFLATQIDPKGCLMSYMRAAFAKCEDFDTEHTHLASKYSLYLYREAGIDEDTRVKGIPVLFIPGNAGSYKQVRPIAAEAAYHFHDLLQHDQTALAAGKRSLDFFSVDFNEDITAFHGQTLLDQAEYLNDAVSYILSLYHNPHRSLRDPSLPDPTSVIIVGHSMGGIVARAMLIQPNYLQNSINTIITLSAPHSRAPVSFDSDIVKIYKDINDYWRKSYSQQWASKNPLWHVTLVSIAGGGLDTVVPSDYATLNGLVPDTHGFTVFTSSIPHVWTGMDHLAIMWCDQFRKAVVRALFDVIDVQRPSQTRSRAERITAFRKHFLTGLEPVIEKQLPAQDSKVLLSLEDESTTHTMHRKGRVVLESFGHSGKTEAHILFMPVQEPFEEKRFTLLTDQPLDGSGAVDVFFCGIQPHQHGQAANMADIDMDIVNGKVGSSRLACKSASADVVALPGSWPESKYAFDQAPPFYYLEYDIADIAEYNFIVIVDKASEAKPGWLIGEFASTASSTTVVDKSFPRLLATGVQRTLPASRPMVNTIHVPVIHSSLLAYKLRLQQSCASKDHRLFRPLLRQYILKPYETKFFPNPSEEININLHGVSPYMTPPVTTSHLEDGLSLQIWSDPSCNGTMSINLTVDVFGSAGKLYMRYRTVFAAFPLLVVALVLRKQFKIYNATGLFISFTESMDQCIRTSLPLLFVALTFLALSLSRTGHHHSNSGVKAGDGATETVTDFTKNELLLGSFDPFFWFLIPLFGIISVGVCIALNYATLAIVHLFASALSFASGYSNGVDDSRRYPASFSTTSSLRRIVTTGILILLVATIIPYQFAYLVLCIVQIATSTRALRQVWDTRTASASSFHNYSHSLLLLLLWILPINIPVLVVWIHNLAVPYLVPFSSHHNIASIMPYMLLVETISTGHMIPRLMTRTSRLTTNALLFAIAVWAAVYGVTWAYTLHWAGNVLAAWLFVVHLSVGLAPKQQVTGGVAAPVAKWVGEVRRSGSRKKRP
ncbi:putative GPI maturation protein [Myriangium duriaei CBS 260.36]|uniref:GPI inositol-deacylase n=1 Tax=Myriangium duriaei CBS 260.36 TaxID=1168546 RepID=A0A9P4J2S3_9PEZI|nr:putative GPI maturation protein [Myriangium duriaei CBS 260.36]